MKIIIALIALSIVLYGASFAFADHPIAKKIKYFLQKFDGVWSVPLTIAGFWLLGTILVSVFGFAAGTYDIGSSMVISIRMAIQLTTPKSFGSCCLSPGNSDSRFLSFSTLSQRSSLYTSSSFNP
jgi:hypothetical protein